MVAGRYKIEASHPDLKVEAKGSQEVRALLYSLDPYLLQRICAARVSQRSPFSIPDGIQFHLNFLLQVTSFSPVWGIEGLMADEIVNLERRVGRSFLS